MLSKQFGLLFCKAELLSYRYLLDNPDVQQKVSAFLLKYLSAEGFYKQLLILKKESTGKKLTESEKKHLQVQTKEMQAVFDYFSLPYDVDLIERIFGSCDKNYLECSYKKLRDRLVHRVNKNVIRIIIERFDAINKDIDSFFSNIQPLTNR